MAAIINTDLEHELVEVDKLKPYDKNARLHSDEQVDQICASMKEFGWTNPILADEDNLIIAGHGRVMAARKLDLLKVPVVRLAGLTPAQKQAYVLADNKLALNASWDPALLGGELKALSELDFNLDVIGFSPVEISDLMDFDGFDVDGASNEIGVDDLDDAMHLAFKLSPDDYEAVILKLEETGKDKDTALVELLLK